MLPPVIRRRKTCPQCRAVVRERPAEAWAVKDMVAQLVRSNLVPDAQPPADARGTNANSQNDIWDGIFHKSVLDDRAHHHEHGEDLHGLGVFDEDDAVYRCLDCMHEIFDGVCSGCGRIYEGHMGDEEMDGFWFGEDIDDIDGHGWFGHDDDDEEEENDDEPNFWPGINGLGFPVPANNPPDPGFPAGNGEWHHYQHDDESGEDEDEEYESSFIDDEEEHPPLHEASGEDPGVIDLVSDDGDAPRVRRRAHHRAPLIASSDEDEVQLLDDPPPIRSRGRMGPIVISSDSESDGEIRVPGGRDFFPRNTRRVIDDSVDEDDDEYVYAKTSTTTRPD
jgi:hypothetical protein